MVRIAVTGAAGRMGKTLIEAVANNPGTELTAALEHPEGSLLGADAGELAGIGKNGVAVSADIAAVVHQFDVLIDFTVPAASANNARVCAENGKKMVLGTTGFSDAEKGGRRGDKDRHLPGLQFQHRGQPVLQAAGHGRPGAG